MRQIIRRRLCRLVVPLLAVCTFGAIAPVGAGAFSPCDNGDLAPTQLTGADLQSTTLCLLNRERTARGLPLLRIDHRLTRAALAHSRDMVTHAYFAHDSRSGATLDARIARTGWMRDRRGWAVGENLAWGSGARAPAGAIVRAWMDSPDHRRNVLHRGFRVVGIGIVNGAPLAGFPEAVTYTTDFGS